MSTDAVWRRRRCTAYSLLRDLWGEGNVATDLVRKSENSFLVLAEKFHAVIWQLEQVGTCANY